MRMLVAKYQTEQKDPNERARERSERADRFAPSWEEHHQQAKALRWRR